MRVASSRVISIRIFACVEERADYLDVTVLRCQCESAVSGLVIGAGEHLADIADASSRAYYR
jgi:hypothetical protein